MILRRLSVIAVVALSAASAFAQPHADAVSTAQQALMTAISARDLAAVQAAVAGGADAGAAGPYQRTPLHEAAKSSSGEVVAWLLSKGASPAARDDDGRTPLHLANSMSAEILLRNGGDAKATDRHGNTALHTAAEGDRAMCRLLVDAGVAVDVRNDAGLTPLHFASVQGAQPVAEYLVGLGADVNAKTNAPYSYEWTYIDPSVRGMEIEIAAGATPLSIARRQHKRNRWSTSRYDALADYLRAHGATE